MSTSHVPQTAARKASEVSDNTGQRLIATVPTPGAQAAGPAQAAQGPMPEPVSAAENPLPARRADLPEEARGRQILSTAFVRMGPAGQMTVELRDGRVLILQNVVMRSKDYCGAEVSGGSGEAWYCGGYADIAAARPDGAR